MHSPDWHFPYTHWELTSQGHPTTRMMLLQLLEIVAISVDITPVTFTDREDIPPATTVIKTIINKTNPLIPKTILVKCFGPL